VLAACNQDLHRKTRDGSFREDLYYRLKVVSIALPALQDRREDIVPLALHFLKLSAREYKTPITGFSPNAIQKLMFHSWPGNVRELENVVRQAAVLADGPLIRAHQLQLHNLNCPAALRLESFKAAKALVIESFELSYLTKMLAACGGNISQAAREAKMDRRAFFALLKKHRLTSSNWKNRNS
jgi:DNA-binding NtrC family response regulator